jgi:hypothetical protein
MVDTLETGRSFGIAISPRGDRDEVLTTSLDFDVYDPARSIAELTSAWVALSSALNSFNRSMGLSDAYPFVLSPRVIEKLGFVHALIGDHRRTAERPAVPAEPAAPRPGDTAAARLRESPARRYSEP